MEKIDVESRFEVTVYFLNKMLNQYEHDFHFDMENTNGYICILVVTNSNYLYYPLSDEEHFRILNQTITFQDLSTIIERSRVHLANFEHSDSHIEVNFPII